MTEQPSFTCPRCGRTSYHPQDAKWGYCGNCHSYTGDDLVTAHPVDEIAALELDRLNAIYKALKEE